MSNTNLMNATMMLVGHADAVAPVVAVLVAEALVGDHKYNES